MPEKVSWTKLAVLLIMLRKALTEESEIEGSEDKKLTGAELLADNVGKVIGLALEKSLEEGGTAEEACCEEVGGTLKGDGGPRGGPGGPLGGTEGGPRGGPGGAGDTGAAAAGVSSLLPCTVSLGAEGEGTAGGPRGGPGGPLGGAEGGPRGGPGGAGDTGAAAAGVSSLLPCTVSLGAEGGGTAGGPRGGPGGPLGGAEGGPRGGPGGAGDTGAAAAGVSSLLPCTVSLGAEGEGTAGGPRGGPGGPLGGAEGGPRGGPGGAGDTGAAAAGVSSLLPCTVSLGAEGEGTAGGPRGGPGGPLGGAEGGPRGGPREGIGGLGAPRGPNSALRAAFASDLLEALLEGHEEAQGGL
jgi:hypothetical protein